MKFQNKWTNLLGTIGLCYLAGAHEGHDMPGALPPPPHGGRVAQAAEVGEHDHESEASEKHEGEGKPAHAHTEEAELFMEAKLSGEDFTVYALELKEGSKTFKSIGPSQELAVAEVKIEFPRSKRTVATSLTVDGDHWVGKVQMNKDRRFIAHIKMIQKNEEKISKIQIEKNRQ